MSEALLSTYGRILQYKNSKTPSISITKVVQEKIADLARTRASSSPVIGNEVQTKVDKFITQAKATYKKCGVGNTECLEQLYGLAMDAINAMRTELHSDLLDAHAQKELLETIGSIFPVEIVESVGQ